MSAILNLYAFHLFNYMAAKIGCYDPDYIAQNLQSHMQGVVDCMEHNRGGGLKVKTVSQLLSEDRTN